MSCIPNSTFSTDPTDPTDPTIAAVCSFGNRWGIGTIPPVTGQDLCSEQLIFLHQKTKRSPDFFVWTCFFDGQKLNWNIIETLVGGFTTVVLMSPTKTRAITERFSRNMNCLCILQKLGKFIIWLRAFIDCFPAKSTSFLLGSWLFPHQTSGTMSHDSQIANGPEISPPRKWMNSH